MGQKKPPTHCLDCGAPAVESTLSRKGLCITCAMKRVEEAYHQMTGRYGPVYEKYLEGLRTFLGVVEPPPSGVQRR